MRARIRFAPALFGRWRKQDSSPATRCPTLSILSTPSEILRLAMELFLSISVCASSVATCTERKLPPIASGVVKEAAASSMAETDLCTLLSAGSLVDPPRLLGIALSSIHGCFKVGMICR